MQMPSYRVFFSHGGDDAYIAREFLCPKVESSGATVFLDAGNLAFGDDFRETILQELAQADELLVLLTHSSIKRPWVFAEIGVMLVRGKRVVAVRYGPSDVDLQAMGVLSLLGNKALLQMEDFNDYVAQLKLRISGNGNA